LYFILQIIDASTGVLISP